MTFGEKVNGFVDWVTDSLVGRTPDGDDPFGPFDEEEPTYETDRNAALKPAYSTKVSRGDNANVAKLPGYKGHEIKIVEPRSFGDATEIVNQLLDQRTVVIDLHLLDKETAQKTIDFVCGAAYAVGGESQKIGDSTVFMFTPKSVQLSREAKETNSFGTNGLWGGNL